MLKNMFKEDGASSDSSMSDYESDREEESGPSELNIGIVHGERAQNGNERSISARQDTRINKKFIDTSDPESIIDSECVFGDVGSMMSKDIAASTSDTSDAEADTTIELYHSTTGAFSISMLQQKRKGIAHQLWPAATFLSRYIETHMDSLCSTSIPENINVLELGAGIGLCGLVCSALKFKKVILSDLPCALDLLNSNIRLNSGKNDKETNSNSDDNSAIIHRNDNENQSQNSFSHTKAMVLSWGVQKELEAVMNEFDTLNSPEKLLVIAADCVYWEVLFKPLYDTIKELVTTYNAEIVISHVRRWKKDEKFFKMCRRTMIVELLEESREIVPAEHTGMPTRVIKRIYRIKAK